MHVGSLEPGEPGASPPRPVTQEGAEHGFGARPGIPVRLDCVRGLLFCFSLGRADLYQEAGVILSSLRQTSGGRTGSGNLR